MAAPLPLAAFPGCYGCGYFRAGSAQVCFACATRELARPGPGSCGTCAQRRAADGPCHNELCSSPRRRIGRVHAIGYQSGPLRSAIIKYKYGGARGMSAVFGRMLVAWLDATITADRPGLIVANPGFTGPGGQEFAHAEAVLAAAAEADSGGDWPFDSASAAAIIKTAPTMKSADAQAWFKRASGNELRAALQVTDRSRTAGKFVLIYDDICTTGTQLDAVAGCLLDEGGAARVEAVVLARAPWRG